MSQGPRPRWTRYAIITVGLATVMFVGAAFVQRSLCQVPHFYRSVESLSWEQRVIESRQFVRQSTAIFNQIENESAWSGVFRERQVNAWLAGDFARKHSEVLPDGVSGPRVSFDDGRVRLGFQLANRFGAAVISAGGRVWLPEPNHIAIEFEKAHAGSLPIPVRIIVEKISSAAKSAGIPIEWREHAGHPVALVRLSEPENETTVQVDRIELRAGLLFLSGRSAQASFDQRAELSVAPAEISLNSQRPGSTAHR